MGQEKPGLERRVTLSRTAGYLARSCYKWAWKKALQGNLVAAWRDLRLGIRFTRKARELRRQGK